MRKYNFFDSYHFKSGLKVNNRIVMSPMTTYSSFFDGTITGDEIKYYRMRSGPGLVITSCANVDKNGKGFEGELGAYEDRFISGLTKVANAIHFRGSKAILQIFSAGRKSNSKVLRGNKPYSASAIADPRPGMEKPRELKSSEIEKIIKDFGKAALRGIQAGFDGIELHGANTYLLQQFFSPHSNRRTDKWGGNLQKRMRFPLAVIEEVRKVIKSYAPSNFILGYRISPEELETPGIRLPDTLKFVDRLSDSPIDYLHTSMGDYRRTSLNDKKDREEINQKILKVINHRIPLIEVGSIITPKQAEDVLNKGGTFAALGRELIREPNWVAKVKSGDEKSIRKQLAPSEMDELGIPGGLQRNLLTDLPGPINFTNETSQNYLNHPAPMENLT